MVGYNLYQTSTLGMQSMSHALNTIGSNIANVNTGGFKRTDTLFETVLSQTMDGNQSDLGGVKPKDYQIIDQQGVVTNTTRDLDLAIVGGGFYQLSNSLTSTAEGNMFYTRDGAFRIATTDETSSVTADDGSTITIANGYLTDKNGYYLLGWTPQADGSFSNTGTPGPMRVDTYAFAQTFQPTTTASLAINLPSSGEILTDHASTVIAANNGTVSAGMETYTISVVDSNGAKRTVNLNFTKSATNQWEVSATSSRASIPQIDTLIMNGTVEAGDVYTVTVNGNTVSYTTTGAEADLSAVRAAMIAVINADALVSPLATATAGTAPGEITLTAATGVKLTTSTSVVGAGPVAQIDTITLNGTVEIGDKYTATIAGTPVTYTVGAGDATIDDIRNGLVSAINADINVNGIMSAAPGAAGEIILTALAAGNTIATSASATNVAAGIDDSTATLANTTASVAVSNDNNFYTAQNTTSQMSAIQTINFSDVGSVIGTQPVTLNFALAFDDAATSTFSLDISDFTQFGSSFLAYSSSNNGLSKANMTRVTFDGVGHVLGDFDDGTQRKIYKVPLATFTNPNGLDRLNGMVFQQSANSGAARTVAADASGIAAFTPYAIEISNVDIADEFTKMIMVQNAYNSNATVFKTVDEMVMTARDLKA